MKDKDRIAKAVRATTEWLRDTTHDKLGGIPVKEDPNHTRDLVACEMVCLYLEAVLREACPSKHEADIAPIMSSVKAEETSRFWEMVERAYLTHRRAMGLDE